MYVDNVVQQCRTVYIFSFSMSVSSLFTCALQVVMSDVILYERDFPYLPGNVRTQLAKVMSRRGILNSRNMPLVSGIYMATALYYAHIMTPASVPGLPCDRDLIERGWNALKSQKRFAPHTIKSHVDGKGLEPRL